MNDYGNGGVEMGGMIRLAGGGPAGMWVRFLGESALGYPVVELVPDAEEPGGLELLLRDSIVAVETAGPALSVIRRKKDVLAVRNITAIRLAYLLGV